MATVSFCSAEQVSLPTFTVEFKKAFEVLNGKMDSCSVLPYKYIIYLISVLAKVEDVDLKKSFRTRLPGQLYNANEDNKLRAFLINELLHKSAG